MEMIAQLETSKFEDCKNEPVSFVQNSVKTCDCYFSVPQKQPFKSVSLEVLDFPWDCVIFSVNLDEEVGFSKIL